ncbi:MAG: hypothetical protein ACE5SW_08860 [Nitrososphaeraceae archaeon]
MNIAISVSIYVISLPIILSVAGISFLSFYIEIGNAVEDNNYTKQNINNLEIIASKVKMTMPGTNMTFGVPLDNAKMHLLEAKMDLKEDNVRGALIQLNFTSDAIKMHEKELADIVKMVQMVEKMNFTK